MDVLPRITASDWPALHASPLEAWRPALEALAEAWDLRGAWERLPGGEDSVVFAQGGSVLKLVPPFLAADAGREVAVLRRIALPVPTPRVLDVRELDGWTAVHMTRLRGEPADQAWARVPHDDRLHVLWAVGSALQALWRTPIDPADGDAAALLARLVTDARRHELDGVRDVQRFLHRNLPDPLPTPSLLHFDLHAGNLMLERREGGWQVSGVLDLVAARAFYAPLDLVTPGVFLCRGERDLLCALLHGAGVHDLPPEQLVAWHLLHPFSTLSRDLAWAGREAADRAAATPVEEALTELWWTA